MAEQRLQLFKYRLRLLLIRFNINGKIVTEIGIVDAKCTNGEHHTRTVMRLRIQGRVGKSSRRRRSCISWSRIL